MDRQRSELNTEDVQLPLLSLYPVLKRILQYVYGSSEGSAALQCRLVCPSFNDLMLKNVRLHLHYVIRAVPYRCQLSLKGLKPKGIIFPTDQLINSSLIDRIFTMKVVRHNTEFFDEADLVRLATRFSRPVDVSLFSSHFLPLLPLAEMPLMRVVEVDKKPSRLDLTPAELNFLANLQHLSRLMMSRTNVQQLSERADVPNISQLLIHWESSSRVQILDVDLTDNFSNLHTLSIIGFICTNDIFDFSDVKLPNLVKCELFLLVLSSFTLASELDSTKRLLTSMHSAMPKLRELSYSTRAVDRFTDADQVAQLISLIFQFCPPTVEDLVLYCSNQELLVHTQLQLKWLFRTLFNSILDSNVTRVSFLSCLSPVMAFRPFRFKKSRRGMDIRRGPPEKTILLKTTVHKYMLERRHGKISTLHVYCLDR